MNNSLHFYKSIFIRVLKPVKLLILLLPLLSFSQVDTTGALTFDFNDHQIREKNNKIIPKPVGVFLTDDRFGNKESAVQIVGFKYSYLNLGTSPLLKSPDMSVSLWFKINRRCYLGQGFDSNPILLIKNSEGADFTNALTIGYECNVGVLAANSTKDSRDEATVLDRDSIIFNRWYHVAVISNDHYLSFYKDGKLIGKSPKNFVTKFLATDSMMIGHTASTKNERYLIGAVDDIQFFHRALSEKEISELYNAPNPNAFKNRLDTLMKYGYIVLGFMVLMVLIIIRNRRALKKQKDELELANRISTLELKAVKAQMNPHFISNCMAAVQDLIYKNDIGKAGLYIAKFSFFLRQVLNYSDENYLTINQEIEMVKLFIELEQLRFKNVFHFKLEIDDKINTGDILIPSLITQPFIENAIWHGLLPLKGAREPQLTVRILMQNEFPVIEIEDNGIGRNPGKKTNIKSRGTQLVLDKIDTLNRLAKTAHYKIEIVDLEEGNTKKGTKIRIQLDNLKE